MWNSNSTTTTFASLQWLFFIFANIVVVPISIGAAFNLPPHEIATILRSSFIVTGIACMLQGLAGHRYPIMEGPSGVIWGLILNLCLSAQALGLSLTEIGGGIATGMALAGLFAITLVLLNLSSLIQKVFTPMVMSVYLFLLTFQLIFIFFNGMLKLKEDGTLHIPITLLSFALVCFVSIIKIKGNKFLSNFSILIGMVVGWGVYSILFEIEKPLEAKSIAMFNLFPFGMPNLEIGIVIVTFLACIVNLSNTVASVDAASKLMNKQPFNSQYKRSYFFTGLYSIIASLFGLVSYAPFASSIGFLESTQIFDRKPFLIGGGLVIILGIFPSLGLFLATLPITVGNAVLFVAYLQLFGTSLKSLNGYSFNSNTIFRIAAPVLLGVSIMNLDARIFNGLPAVVQPIFSNGFIIGVILSIFIEKLINWDNFKL